jgi:hypothetical protein
MAGNIVQVKLSRSGTSIAGGVHRGIAELFTLIGNEIERRGYMFHPGWCWGAECRAISGSNTPSNHCLTGDTRVVTRAGSATLAELAGAEVELLTAAQGDHGQGRWVRAPVNSYGTESVVTLTLQRGSDTKQIRATLPHRWFVRDATKDGSTRVREVRTAELQVGDRLMTTHPQRLSNITLSAFGVCHGVTYGDGTLFPNGSGKVALWGDKVALLEWFPSKSPMSSVSRDTGITGIEVRSLPSNFKSLPGLNEPPSYLAGWLAGYIATDGHARSGELRISSRSKDVLDHVAVVAQSLGIATMQPKVQKQSGGYKPGDQWSLAFVADTVPEWLFIRPAQHEAFDFGRRARRGLEWRVSMIEDLGEVEPVYCATVEGYGSFVLEDWILTGNSWGLAVDINAPNNPYTSSGVHDIPDWAYNLFRSYGFGCGADYSGKKDWMHIEAMGTPSDMAIMTSLARQNLAGGGPVVVPPDPSKPPVVVPSGHPFLNQLLHWS